MVQTTWVALVLGCWSSLYLIDAFLKVSNKCRHRNTVSVQHKVTLYCYNNCNSVTSVKHAMPHCDVLKLLIQWDSLILQQNRIYFMLATYRDQSALCNKNIETVVNLGHCQIVVVFGSILCLLHKHLSHMDHC